MTSIKATCPTCGEVELTAEEVTVVVCSSHAQLSYYAFDCAGCVQQVRKPADRRVVSLLVAGGVVVTHWQVPAEFLEAKSGPALTYDDLLDFALRLKGTTRLAAFARPTQTA